MLMPAMIESRQQATRLRTPLPQRRIRPRYALPAKRILRHGIRNTLRIQKIRIQRQVINIIALLVIARIKRLASLTTKQLCFLRGLEDLGASEQATGGDAVFEECGVVGTQGEEGGDVGEAAGLVEELEVALDGVGARGAGEVEGAAVAVVDAEDVVGRGDHVKVEVGAEFGDFAAVAAAGAVEGFEVVERAEFAKFFGAPEAQADSVFELEFGEGQGGDECADGAGAIVVDARAREDGVGVAADHEDIVVVTLLGLGDDVVVGAVLSDGINGEGGSDSAISELCKKLISGLLGQTDNWCIVTFTTEGSREALKGNVVVDDSSHSSCSFGIGSLDRKCADTSRDKGNLSRYRSRVVCSVASQIVDLDKVGSNLTGWTKSEVLGRHISTSSRNLNSSGSEQLNEGLLVDVVVPSLQQSLVEPFRSGIVACTSKSAVATVFISEGLELL